MGTKGVLLHRGGRGGVVVGADRLGWPARLGRLPHARSAARPARRRSGSPRSASPRCASPAPQAARALRARPGIRFVQRVVARSQHGRPRRCPCRRRRAVPEWQFARGARGSRPRLGAAGRGAQVTIAVVDTGADLTVPALAAKQPDHLERRHELDDVARRRSATGRSSPRSPPARSDPVGMSGFGGEARLMIVQANRGGTGFSDIDEANAIV